VKHLFRKLVSLAFLITAWSNDAANAGVQCKGVPGWVMVDQNGTLTSDFGFGPLYLCNVAVNTTSPWFVAADSCKAYMAELMTAKSLGREFALQFVTATTCVGIRSSSGWPIEQPVQYYMF